MPEYIYVHHMYTVPGEASGACHISLKLELQVAEVSVSPGRAPFQLWENAHNIRVLGLNPGPLQERAASALNCLPSL